MMKSATRFWAKLCAAMLFLLTPELARADVVIGFYSYDLDVGLVTHFPHAFVTLTGTTADGQAVDENIGFTARSVSPALLMGSVKGMVETKPAKYISESDRQFEIKISDDQYRSIKKITEKWASLEGKSYHIDKRNCIHFVGEVAQSLNLQVDLSKKIIRKPRAFLQRVLALNPTLVPLIPVKASKKDSKKDGG
jgi:hypothetical protein